MIKGWAKDIDSPVSRSAIPWYRCRQTASNVVVVTIMMNGVASRFLLTPGRLCFAATSGKDLLPPNTYRLKAQGPF